MTRLLAWWARLWAPREDPILRVTRMLDVAKAHQMATIAWTDPALGEVRCAFYAATAPLEHNPDVKQPTVEEILTQRVREMAPGFHRAPLPRPPTPPLGLRPDGMD